MDTISLNTPPKAQAERTATDEKARTEKEQKLKKVCRDFESILVYQLLKTMRQSIPKGGILGGSYGKDTYEMLFDKKIADDLAQNEHGLGMQKVLYNQLASKLIK
jgi:flagellar protein FlgJ